MKKQNILIVGIDSLIGSNLKRKLSKYYNIYGTSYRREKINKKTFYLNLKKPKINFKGINFDAVIMCAGKNKLDFSQKNQKESYLINYVGIKKILQIFLKKKTFIVFISSNLVFSGNKQFYKINDIKKPKSMYGIFKFKIENFLKKKNKKNICILRLTKVYSDRHGFLFDWRKKIRLKKNIYLDNSFKISPISLNYAVNNLSKIIIKKKSGIYQLSDKREYTLKEFFIKKIGYYKRCVENKSNLKWRNKFNSLSLKTP